MADLAPTVQTLAQLAGYGDWYVKPGDEVYVVTEDVFYVYRNPGTNPPADGFTIIDAIFLPGFWQRGAGGGDETGLSYNTIAVGALGSGRLIDVDPTILNDGISVAWVKSVKDYFRWNATSTATADNITIVNPTLNGVNPGRFFREFQFAPDWMQQRQWVIRPTTGNDENSGADDVTPLASSEEFHRRMGVTGGHRPEWGPGDYHIFAPEGIGLAVGLNVRLYLAGRRSQTTVGSAFVFNTQVYVHGNTPSTVGQGVTFAGPFTIRAVTAVNRPTNQTLEVASAGIVGSWTAAVLISTPGSNVAKRCRMTTGTNIGGTFWAKEDLGNKLGGNPTAMIDEPAVANTYSGSFALNINTFTPLVGEQFVVETLLTMAPHLDMDVVPIIFDSCSLSSMQEARNGTVVIDKCQIVGGVSQQSFNGVLTRAQINGTRWSGATSSTSPWVIFQNVDLSNCNFDGFWLLRIQSQGIMTRGFIHGLSGGIRLSSTVHSNPTSGSTRTAGWVVNSLAIFNVTNTLPFGIEDTVGFSATCELWGSGNAFSPVVLFGGAKLLWPAADVRGGPPPASFFYITFTPGNWVACDDVTNGNSAPAWDIAASAFTALRLLSAANLQLTVAAGGFNGRFFDPVSGCAMIASQQG